jgi:hypothetical protein
MVLLDVGVISGSLIHFAELIVHLPAFSEHVPVIHIVGTPNTLQLKTKPMLHHTLGDGRFVNLISVRVWLIRHDNHAGLTRTKKPPNNSPFPRPISLEKRTLMSRSTVC